MFGFGFGVVCFCLLGFFFSKKSRSGFFFSSSYNTNGKEPEPLVFIIQLCGVAVIFALCFSDKENVSLNLNMKFNHNAKICVSLTCVD